MKSQSISSHLARTSTQINKKFSNYICFVFSISLSLFLSDIACSFQLFLGNSSFFSSNLADDGPYKAWLFTEFFEVSIHSELGMFFFEFYILFYIYILHVIS